MTKQNKFVILLVLGVLAVGFVGGGIVHVNHRQSEITNTTTDALLASITPDELVKRSNGAVLGTVTNLKVEKIPSNIRPEKEDIVTNATIKVEKYLYNPEQLTSDEIIVQVVGGVLGDESMSAEGSPSFKIGDRVVIFLRKKDKSQSVYTVYGWAQGKYTVDNNGIVAVGNESIFLRDVFGKEHMTLDEFENSVASIVSKIR
ncbi:MAG: hypothetical protein GXP44_02865 [bacterium]|nr:hypothetical protein [bacterium]